MKTEYTAGPWYTASTGNHQGLIISESTGANIAGTYDNKDSALIASAPDMLESLRQIVSDFDFCGNESSYGDRLPAYIETARAAIHKATGGDTP